MHRAPAWACAGVLFACPALAQPPGEAQQLTNPGFEGPPPILGFPADPPINAWFGDLAEQTGPADGIDPVEGGAMLRFIACSFDGPSAGCAASEVFQWIDLNDYAEQIDAGVIALEGGALFNRVAGDGQSDTEFRVRILAHDDLTPSSTQIVSGAIASKEEKVLTDDDPATWEPAAAMMVLPAGTRFVAFRLTAIENVSNDARDEYDGHFADDATLDLTCTTDLDGDGMVGTNDLNALLYGLIDGSIGDVNADGVVDTEDLLVLLSVFGQACGP